MRRILFWSHLTVGCIAGVVVLVMSVTGILLAYRKQVTAWADGGLRANPAAQGSPRLPIQSLVDKASTQGRPTAITLRSDPSAPVEIALGRERTLFVDPHTGTILGEGSTRVRAFFEAVENWHRWLAMSGENRATGRAITGACNLGFLFLVISGPFLWIPRKWSWPAIRAVLLFRRGLSGKARDFNWHNVAGIWCAAVLLLIVASGVVMSYPWANDLLYRISGTQPPQQNQARQPRREGRQEGEQTVAAGADALWARAAQQVPAWRSITLRVPPSNKSPLTFQIDQGDGGRPDLRSQATLDPRSGEIIRWEPFSSYNSGRRTRVWLRFLHTGEAGGVAGESIAAIASAGAVVLVWTGLALATRRLLAARRRARTADREPATEYLPSS